MTLTSTPATALAAPVPPAPAASATPAHWSGVDADSPWLARAVALVPELRSTAEAVDRSGSFVVGGIARLREQQLLSMLVPTELGGGGASFAETGAVLATLAHGCPATSLTFSMHLHLVAAQVWRWHRGLPAPVLTRVAQEHLLLVSTGASDWLSSSGTARRVEDGYRVSARKGPASGAPAGNVLVTSIRCDDGADGPQVLHCSVPFTAAGVRIEETWDTMGMRGTGSHTVVLDDVFVPDVAVMLARPADVWHPIWATVLGVALPLIMASYVGVAEAAASAALELAARRADRPDCITVAGRMATRLGAARDTVATMLASSADLRFDNTLPHAITTLARKATATDAVLDTVRAALELGRGAAYGRSSEVERLFRDAHGALYHPLPAAQQEVASGRMALGLDPFV